MRKTGSDRCAGEGEAGRGTGKARGYWVGVKIKLINKRKREDLSKRCVREGVVLITVQGRVGAGAGV